MSKMQRYTLIAPNLEAQEAENIRVTFEEVEEWIGSRLPESARTFASWWHGTYAVWKGDGWTATPKLENETVLFRRRVQKPDQSLSALADAETLTATSEQKYLDKLTQKMTQLKGLMAESQVPLPNSPSSEWYEFLERIKLTLGNLNNDLSFIGCLQAQEYLRSRFDLQDIDVAAKLQGAPGLDIDALTSDGLRVVGELKTTKTYGSRDFGAVQRSSFESDFAKLEKADAAHKYLFLTHSSAFEVVKQRYGHRLANVTVVLLTTGEEWAAEQTRPTLEQPAEITSAVPANSEAQPSKKGGQAEQILSYIEAHKPQCDDCIAERMNLPQRQTVNIHARRFTAQGQLTRAKGTCVVCKGTKIVNTPVAAGTDKRSPSLR